MFLVNAAMEDVSIGTAALIVVLGMAVVFFGLILVKTNCLILTRR